jgi:hypothetical protein
MRTVELFSGTKSFSRVAHDIYGATTLTFDNDPETNPDVVIDILDLKPGILKRIRPDIIWASPPCTAFSVASIGTHWAGGKNAYIPKTEQARVGIALVEKTLSLIGEVKPTWWFIENPRGVLRNLPLWDKVTNYRRHTITYCQYGDTRMKPTDIWTNALWWIPRVPCKNGDDCHEAAPRGSKTGTQGLKGAKERGVIPPELFDEIFQQMPA